MNHTVQYVKAYFSGHLAGVRLIQTQKFDRRADAILFSKGDGGLYNAGNGGCDYRRFNSVITTGECHVKN